MSNLSVAFLWHLHQPFYRTYDSQVAKLPWVRLHSSKTYLPFARIIEKFPNIHSTFNITPCLLEQIMDYNNGGEDYFQQLSMIDSKNLSQKEKEFILENFFSVNYNSMLTPNKRFAELKSKRDGLPLNKAIEKYNTQDWTDLQVLFNLVWFHPIMKEEYPEIKEISAKKQNFSNDDVKIIINTQLDIMKKIVPVYKSLYLKGNIELTTTPYYHPILPIMAKPDDAYRSMPGITLPNINDVLNNDVDEQIAEGINLFSKLFDSPPSGMWPAEGSVSSDVAKRFSKYNIKWIASDEDVLSKSVNITFDRNEKFENANALCIPYKIMDTNLHAFFRDKTLSNKISFDYHKMQINEAMNDLIKYYNYVKNSIQDDNNYILPIILDGENPWEYYPNSGYDFLTKLFETLNEENIPTTTFSEYLENNKEIPKTIDSLFPASWISCNFHIWIGQEEENKAWNYLKNAKEMLNTIENPTQLSKKSIMAAEGSDWFWWFDDDFYSIHTPIFDKIFRKHLINVYSFEKKQIPDYLYKPIKKKMLGAKFSKPFAIMDLKLDGKVTDYFEWMPAGNYESTSISQVMSGEKATKNIIKRMFYGFNYENIFLRLDTFQNPKELLKLYEIEVKFIQPEKRIIRIYQENNKYIYKISNSNELWDDVAVDSIIEIALSLDRLKFKALSNVEFLIDIFHKENIIETLPETDLIKFQMPGPDFDIVNWQV